MTRTRTLHQLAIAGAFLAFIGTSTLGDEPPPRLALPQPGERVPRPSRPTTGTPSNESSGGWWLSSVGVVAALAVFGGVSLASKRFLPNRESGPIQVVGRSSLSTKHSVYLLRVGERVLIVGAGPQGAPSTLGEVTDPAELARLIPRRPNPRPRPASPMIAPATGFDRRIGDDE